MPHRKWLVALVALVAVALVEGCGSSGSSSSSSSSTGASSGSSSGSSSGGSRAADVKSACLNALKNVPYAEQSAVQTGCQQAAVAFTQCAIAAHAAGASKGSIALNGCQSGADHAVAALKAANPKAAIP